MQSGRRMPNKPAKSYSAPVHNNDSVEMEIKNGISFITATKIKICMN